MRRVFILIFALILASCTGAPSGYTWCYTYDLSNPVNSVGTAISIYDGTVVGTGIQSVSGELNIEMGSEPNNVGQPQPMKFAMTVYNPGAPFNVNWGVYAFRSDWGGSSDSNPSGRSTLYGNPTTASTTDGYASASITAGASDVLIAESATVYGTGTNPYPRNDCATPPTATPPPATNTAPAPTNTPLGGDGLSIPMDSAFASLNDWIALLAPVILFIGMIPVALIFIRWIMTKIRDGFGGA